MLNLETPFFADVAAGVSPAVECGVPPPGATPSYRKVRNIFQYVRGFARLGSTGQDARFYGRQDACRYENVPEPAKAFDLALNFRIVTF